MPQLNEKRDVIIHLLNRLREFNPAIGEYDKSIMNSDFQYAVKLHNGRINLSQELVHDYEQSPGLVADQQLKAVATNFTSGLMASELLPLPAPTEGPELAAVSGVMEKKRSSSSKFLLSIAALIVLSLIGYYTYTQINKEKEESTKVNVRNNITDYVNVETNNYKYSSLGGIIDLQVVVSNSTQYTLDNVKVEISYIKKNGGVWQNKVVDTDMIGPQMNMTIKVPDTFRGTSVRCRVVAVKSASLGL